MHLRHSGFRRYKTLLYRARNRWRHKTGLHRKRLSRNLNNDALAAPIEQAFHHTPQRKKRHIVERNALCTRPCQRMHHATFPSCHIRLARQGMQGSNFLWSHAYQAADASWQRIAPCGRQRFRERSNDAHNITSDRLLIQISMACCARIFKPLENRRDDSLHQTVVRRWKYPRHVICQHSQHGSSRSRFSVFRNRMDWTKCQTRDTSRTS